MAANRDLASTPVVDQTPVLDTSQATKPSPTEQAAITSALAEVETLKAEKARLETQLSSVSPAVLKAAQEAMALPPESRSLWLDGIADLKSAAQSGTSLKRVPFNGIEDPADDWRPSSQDLMATDEPGALTVLMHLEDRVDEQRHVNRLTADAITEIQTAFANFVTLWDNERVQREFGVTADLIARARATGATDLRKFFTEFPPAKATNGKKPAAAEVPEAPDGDSGEYDPEDMSEEAKMELWRKGSIPTDKRMAARMREAYGPPGQG